VKETENDDIGSEPFLFLASEGGKNIIMLANIAVHMSSI